MDITLYDQVIDASREELAAVVKIILGDERVELCDWQAQVISGGLEANTRITRFQGTCLSQGKNVPWSVVLKAIKGPPGDPEDVKALTYWQREALAYQSGILNQLSADLSAPACYAVQPRSDNEYWLWLEEIQDSYAGQRPLDTYGVAARQLGRFNAQYLNGSRPLPDQSFLLRNMLRTYCDIAVPALQMLKENQDHPLIRRWYPAGLEYLFRFWEAREAFFRPIEAQPRTFAHQDAFRRNLFARVTLDGAPRTVLIDWAYVGTAAPGEELIPILGAFWWDETFERVKAMDGLCFENHLAGLEEAGWKCDPRRVRFVLAAGMMLRYELGTTYEVIPMILNPAYYPFLEKSFHCTIEQLADLVGLFNVFYRDFAAEAWQLKEELGL